ncbi:breast cancer metastasis-suppressor 1-like protein [Aphis gossypii]|uniref:Breast cancer metastasis-suppressor 1-like protein n=1 Tax=Aphis gossypii TaxID=80765 RepID=A0A9P0J9W6_APHGO|nr:breast cancer metastasis-suppressor 1-like protein [Aphis gossypii]CAH1730910.1 unnamed protein product [Aphis gossypii]
MSTTSSSDNSDINSKIKKVAEDCGSDIAVRKIVCSEKLKDIPYNMKKYSETSVSSLSSSSESNNSDYDTDNSSDLNSDENEKLMDTCTENLQNIGTDMYYLNTLLYSEKIREVEKKIVEVRLGTAKEYRIPLQKLQDKMKSRLEKASVLRQFKLANLKNKYEAEEQAIEQNFENNKEILYDTIKADLEEQIQQLEEARNEVDVDASLWLGFGRSLTRSGRGRGRRPYDHIQPKRKPVTVSGPCIVYNLMEDEILEDWTKIKKLLSSSKRKEKKMQQNKPHK